MFFYLNISLDDVVGKKDCQFEGIIFSIGGMKRIMVVLYSFGILN